jgi:hypothetical protein
MFNKICRTLVVLITLGIGNSAYADPFSLFGFSIDLKTGDNMKKFGTSQGWACSPDDDMSWCLKMENGNATGRIDWEPAANGRQSMDMNWLGVECNALNACQMDWQTLAEQMEQRFGIVFDRSQNLKSPFWSTNASVASVCAEGEEKDLLCVVSDPQTGLVKYATIEKWKFGANSKGATF